MLELDDDRWSQLVGGYQVPYDCRSALSRLRDSSTREAAWEELWQELHHQGDIGPASLAAVPYLVDISEEFETRDWNVYALVGLIEEIRLEKGLPLPEWIADSYPQALTMLSRLAAQDVTTTTDRVEVTSALGLIALAQGLLVPGRLLLSYSVEELVEMEQLYHTGDES